MRDRISTVATIAATIILAFFISTKPAVTAKELLDRNGISYNEVLYEQLYGEGVVYLCSLQSPYLFRVGYLEDKRQGLAGGSSEVVIRRDDHPPKDDRLIWKYSFHWTNGLGGAKEGDGLFLRYVIGESFDQRIDKVVVKIASEKQKVPEDSLGTEAIMIEYGGRRIWFALCSPEVRPYAALEHYEPKEILGFTQDGVLLYEYVAPPEENNAGL